MKLLKAIWETLLWYVKPHCDHEAGICIKGQGRDCRFKEDKNGIERKNYHFENGVHK